MTDSERAEVTVNELDTRLAVAIRAARHHHLSYFFNALQKHRQHETFRLQDWPFSREMGFTCKCSGVDREWRINITSLAKMIPEVRDSYLRFRKHTSRQGNKAKKRDKRRADRKAKALLHRFLTREQRWELRATRGFTVKGRDNRTYQVTEGNCNNVRLLEDGSPRYSLCVVPASGVGTVPIYDMMLAHKVLLECDPQTFLRTAQVQDIATKRIFVDGSFLADGVDPPPVNEVCEDVPDLLPLPQEVLDDPLQWVEERLHHG